MKLLLATRNRDKITEIRALFESPGLHVISATERPELPDVVEDQPTLEGNAEKKARECALHTGLWAMADDTGLEVAALDGAPGVYSARYAGPGATYADNCRKLLEAMDGVEHRRARFRSVIALSDPRGETRWVDGVCEGEITRESRGEGGFGYDPIFLPDGHDQTFAELDLEEKNRISHRGRALVRAREEWRSILQT